MTNPIDNGSGRVNRPAVNGSQAGRPNTTSAEDGNAVRRDPGVGADSSEQSGRLQQLRASVEQTPDVDTPRVDQIRDQIARGDYPLDPERIASRFVEFEQLINE